MNTKSLTHVVGTFLIQAEGAFLNGAGLGDGEDRNMTTPKTFSDFRDRVPYVSSQAWKRWLRNTFQEENPDEKPAMLVQIGTSAKGTTSKIGTEMDPVQFAEDDIFGYMRAQQGQGKVAKDEDTEDDEAAEESEVTPKGKAKERVAAVMRPAPFAASILVSLRKSGWEGVDEGFVHLKEGTPLPYSTRFYNTQLQGVFGLSYERLGVFRNEGDRIELDAESARTYLQNGAVQIREENKEKNWRRYEMANNPRKARATKILKALAILRGGAKQAQFGTDVAPKVLILAGLTCGNLIFNDLFEDTKEGPKLKLDTLKEIVADYADRIVTRVFVGIRMGYLHPESERQLKEWANEANSPILLTTPIQAVTRLTEALP